MKYREETDHFKVLYKVRDQAQYLKEKDGAEHRHGNAEKGFLPSLLTGLLLDDGADKVSDEDQPEEGRCDVEHRTGHSVERLLRRFDRRLEALPADKLSYHHYSMQAN